MTQDITLSADVIQVNTDDISLNTDHGNQESGRALGVYSNSYDQVLLIIYLLTIVLLIFLCFFRKTGNSGARA